MHYRENRKQSLLHQRSSNMPNCPAPTQKPFSWDFSRTLRQAVINSFMYTPIMHLYFMKVTPYITLNPSPRFISSETSSMLLRASIHTFLILPLNQSKYWYCQGVMRNNWRHEEGKRLFRKKCVNGNALWLSFVFWLPVTYACYMFVPLHFGNLYIDSTGLIWAVILSYLGTYWPNTKCLPLSITASLLAIVLRLFQ